MYTAKKKGFVQCRAGATAAARADSDKASSISKLKTTISGYDIEPAFFDIDKASISGYTDIEVKSFNINVYLISYCFDIEVMKLQYRSFSSGTLHYYDIIVFL